MSHPFYDHLRADVSAWSAECAPAQIAGWINALAHQTAPEGLPAERLDLARRLCWLVFGRAPALSPVFIALGPMYTEHVATGRETLATLIDQVEQLETSATTEQIAELDRLLFTHGDALAELLRASLGSPASARIDAMVDEAIDRVQRAIQEGDWEAVPLAGPDAARNRAALAALPPAQAAAVYARWQRAGERAEQQDLRGAVSAIEAAIEAAPNLAESYVRRASYKFARQDLVGAGADVERATALDASHAAARAMRAEFRMHARDLPGALADWDQAIALAPEHAPFRIGRAQLRAAAGRLPDALADLDDAARLSPDDALVYFHRASLRFRAQNVPGTLEDLDRVIALRPEQPQPWLHRGSMRMMLRDAVGAKADFDEAIRLRPTDPAGYAKRAGALLSTQDAWSAMIDAMTALALAPDDWNQREQTFEILKVAPAHLSPGWDPTPLEQRLEHVAATADADTAVRFADLIGQHAPDTAPRWDALRYRTYMRFGRHNPAADAASSWVGHAPGSAEALMAAAEVRLLLEDPGSALEALDRAKGLAHQLDRDATFALYQLRGRALASAGRLGEAVSAFRDAAANRPDRADVWFYLGVHLDLLGDRESAIEAYDRSIENDSAFAPAWYNRACEHAQLGRRHEALADLARAITLDPRLRAEATGDDYLRSLRADPAFLRLTQG